MGQLAEHLVGRSAELVSLDGTLAALERGHPLAVELVGEPGIGKTRLLAELGARADARGHLVLAGSASELERDYPFWLFVDALDEYVEALDPCPLERLHADVRAELGHVLPALATGGDGAMRAERHRTHAAVRELLELLATTKPLVLALDDVHWADPASVELLGGLLRRPPSGGVLLALALRPRQLPGRLSAVLDRGLRDGVLARYELGALTRDEAGELLGEDLDGALAAALYEESGGNPFYLQELARSPGRAPPVARTVSLGGVDVPRLVIGALNEELALLSADERRTLEGAAVVGDPFEPDLAAAAAERPMPAALAALDALLRVDLVRPTEVPRRFRFRHPIVRRAVYEAAPGGWRLGAHERAAAALAARGASATARAHHVERSAAQGDAAAVSLLREAGEAAARLAPASAARWFGGALRLLPDTAPPAERVELLLARAEALVATGEYDDGHAALLEALRLVPAEAAALRVGLTAGCAEAEHMLGRHEVARARLEAALGSLPSRDTPEAVALMLELAADGFYRMRFDVMLDWTSRGLAVARALGDDLLIAMAAASVAMALTYVGPLEDAEAACTQAAARVDALSDAVLARRLAAASRLAAAELYLDRFDAAAAHAERALALARATGQGATIAPGSRLLGRVKVSLGQLADAAELLGAAVEAQRLAGNAQDLAWALLNRSFAALPAGDVQLALATAQESVELTAGMDTSLVALLATAELAAALLAVGEPARAVDVLVHAGGADLALHPGARRASALEVLAGCRLALGQPAEAARAAAAAAACAEAFPTGVAVAAAQRAAAAVALDGGDAAGAAERALASAAAADGVGAPVEAAVSRTLAGRALAAAGRQEAAIAELERAADALHACGALRHRDEAERELRKLGRRIRRRTRAGQPDVGGVESLTERELQIARLVVDRRTNPGIAAELFLSRKTVEAHLRNIFIKLDVSSRVEVARAIERADREAADR